MLGVILARGGSVRVPRKNIKILGDKPLIGWTIDAARKSQLMDYFLVSTNDDEIIKISKDYGAWVPFKRPEDLSCDCDSVLPLIHAVEWFEKNKNKEVSHVVCLQPTSPFRTGEDIDRCIDIALQDPSYDTVFTVTKVSQHPYWMFERKRYSHELLPYSDAPLEGENLVSQNLPLLWYPNGAVYVTRKDVIMAGKIFGEKRFGPDMPRERSVDLEEEMDFVIASAMIPIIKEKHYDKFSWVIP